MKRVLSTAAAIVAVVGATTAIMDLMDRLTRSEIRVVETRESCGDAVSQLARFAAECSVRCMGD